MKTVKHILLLLPAAFALTGCFKEDYSFCPPEGIQKNIRFDFHLEGAENDFLDHITAVDVGIFDGEGKYIETQRVEMAEFVELALPAGDYRFIFWGNVHDNTDYHELEDGAPHITYSHIDGTTVTGDADKLYYAPHSTPTRAEEAPHPYYPLAVTETTNHQDDVWFTHAHRTLNISVRGFEDENDPGALPIIEIEGLPAGHGIFGREELLEYILAQHTTTLYQKDGKDYAGTSFDTFHFDELDMENIFIVIRDSAGNEIFRVSLADAIDESNTDPNKIVIDLLITFTIDVGVKITMPGWSGEEVGIDFD